MIAKAYGTRRACAALQLTAFGSTLALIALPAGGTLAQEPAPAATPAPANCSVVGMADIAALLGMDVQDADPLSRKGGVCSFTSRSVSDDGTASYAVVTAEQVAQRRPYFRLMQLRCGGVRSGAPNAPLCSTYSALAKARTIGQYYAARTAGADPIQHLGDAAAASAGALYVRTGPAVIEASVHRDNAFDLARSTALARMLLERRGG